MSGDRADFGSRLRAAREARGISLKDIAAATKISPLVLEALERNDPSRLPGGLFSRAFVRSYAKEVGLDPDQAVREFEERFGGGTEATEERMVRATPPRGVRESPGGHNGVGWLGLAVTVLLVVVWIGVDRYFSRRAENAPARRAGTAQSETAPVPAPPPMPKLEAPKAPVAADRPPASAARKTEQPAATSGAQPAQPPPRQVPQSPVPQPGQPAVPPPTGAPAAEPSAAQPPATEARALRVVVTANAASWVSAKVDDQRVAGRTLQPGETLELSAARTIVLTAGNAGGISYTINGAAGRSLGAADQVVTVVITAANYRSFLASGT